MDDLTTTADFETSAPSIETASAETTPTVENAQADDLDALWQNVRDTKTSVDPKQAEPETPQVETQPEATAEAREDETEADILAEFDKDRIPSDEELQKKYIRHTSKEARAELIKYAESARRLADLENKLGGQNAVPTLERVSQALFTPEVTQHSAVDFLQTLDTTNPNLLNSVGEIVFQGVWSNPDPQWQQLIDRQLEGVFGKNRETIAEMCSWMDANLFDPELLREEYKEANFENPLVSKLQNQIAELTERTQTEKQQTEIQTQARQEYQARLLENSNQFITKSVQSHINPIIEKLAWAKSENDPPEWAEAKEIFGEMRDAWIQNAIHNSPEAKNIKYLLENGQAFDKQGNPSQNYLMQLERIQGKVKASTLKAGKALQKTFTKSLLSSRNAQIQPITNLEQPNAVPQTQRQQSAPQTGNVSNSNDDLDAIWQRHQASVTQNAQATRRLMNGRG